MHFRRTGSKLVLLALVILLCRLAPYPQAFATAMRQAYMHQAAGEYGSALAAYQQAAGFDPESPRPWLGMGEVFLVQHRFVQATVAFLEGERLGGGAEAVLGQAESYAGRQDWAAALRDLHRAQALAPDQAGIYVALARANMAQGRFEQAQSYASQALQLQPSAAEAAAAHALLGRLLAGDEPAIAANHFRQAGDADMLAVLDAVNAEASEARRALLLGIAALQRSELSLARYHFERGLALAPGDAEAAAYLAHTLDLQGETVVARELLEQALALDGDSALVYYFLGMHHRLVGSTEAAQAALWQALLRDPDNAALRAEMAGTFVDQSDYPNAEAWYQGAVEVAPDEVDFHLMLVHFYLDHLYRVGERGLPAAQALVELAPDDARAHDLLGWAYYLIGQPAEGLQALRQALILDSGLVSAHFHLGSLYVYTGQHDLAGQHLQRAADLDKSGFYRSRAELLLKDLD
jgi:Flp pilus assembly protein TadD